MFEKLKKYHWAIGLGVVTLTSFVGAYSTNRLIATRLEPPEKVEGLPPPGAGASRTGSSRTERTDSPPSPSEPGDPAEEVVLPVETETGPSRDEYTIVLTRNLFDSANSLMWPDTQPSGDLEGGEQAPMSEPLNIRLLGTVVVSPRQFSWAVLSKNENNALQETFRVDDDIYGMGTLDEVLRNKIVVRKPDGETQTVSLWTGEESATPVASASPGAAGEGGLGSSIRKVGDNKYEIEAREIQSAMENMEKVTSGARIVPSFENGNSVGFKVFRIKPDSIYSKLGIRNGDVISKINGFEINSTEKALQMYQMLRTEKNISLDVTRRGQKMTMEYTIR